MTLALTLLLIYVSLGTITFLIIWLRGKVEGTFAVWFACSAAWPLLWLGLLIVWMEPPKPPVDPTDALPMLYGGDGTSFETAVIVNCYSMSSAKNLMDSFIEERHGAKGVGWTPGIEFTEGLDASNWDGESGRTIRTVVIRLADGSDREYYFDRTKPIRTSARFHRWAGLIPDRL